MARGEIETELKFTGAPGDVAALPESLFMKAMVQGRGGEWERLSSTYYDTPDLALEQAGLSLRLREENGARVQAVKRPRGEGAIIRDEFECALGEGAVFPAKTGDPSADALIEAARADLAPSASTIVDCWSAVVRFGVSEIEIAVDLGRAECRGADGVMRTAPLAEVELELVEGEAGDLFDLGRLLIRNAPLRISTRTKLEYARSLAGAPIGLRKGAGCSLRRRKARRARLTVRFCRSPRGLQRFSRSCLRRVIRKGFTRCASPCGACAPSSALSGRLSPVGVCARSPNERS